jgi:hypothetical protein
MTNAAIAATALPMQSPPYERSSDRPAESAESFNRLLAQAVPTSVAIVPREPQDSFRIGWEVQSGLRFSAKAAMPSRPSGATALQEIASAIISYASAWVASICR